jgi:hypothetical protein
LAGKTLAGRERVDAKFDAQSGAQSGTCFVIFLPLAERLVAPAPQTASRA